MELRSLVLGAGGTVVVAAGVFAALVAANAQDAPDPVPAPSVTVEPSVAPSIAPCEYEDGSNQALPCRWDASTSGNGIGLSFTIWPAADGGTTYIYDNGEVDHFPPADPVSSI